ncbi:MAG: heme lyase CcmF/NrfE family subunit [Actinomycetota bacterium]
MDIASAGRFLLYAAFAGALMASMLSLLGYRRKNLGAVLSGQRALISSCILTGTCLVLLIVALYIHDFSIGYVVSYTSRSTPKAYTFTALWAGMEGSLLLWASLTAAYATTAVVMQRSRRADLVPVATAVFGSVLAFFLGLLAFSANPFATISPIPIDGKGLTPLLQSPFMAIHPVLLYLGLTGLIVPFGFAVSALVRGRLDPRWFTSTRRWTVLAWSFLTLGIILGGAWAYMELGWGGYWAWDPVENASFLPWLTATAFLHSVMIQERRGMLKVWNVALILATYSLSLFGTFLTRSGLLVSVHTFSESPVGKYLLPLLGFVAVGSFALLGWRYDRLRSDRHLDSVISRESAFMFNNLLFVALAFTVLWGTIYPVLVEATNGSKISVGPPFFNSVFIPTGLALFALSGVGPLVAWRRASTRSLRRQFALPLSMGMITIVSLAISGMRSWAAMFALGLCAFVASATLGEFVSGARAHHGLLNVIRRNKRRYGGYIVHLGVVLIVLGFSGNAFRQSTTTTIKPGMSFKIGDYDILYARARTFSTPEKVVNMAVMKVARNGKDIATLRPQRNFHLAQRTPQSEIGLRTSLVEDLYLVLTRMDRDTTATVRAWVNPLVAWVWIGAFIMSIGMVVILAEREGVPA